MSRKIATRLHVGGALADNQVVDLDAQRAHFLRNVLRLKPGALVLLFNGLDGEWLACLDELGRDRASLRIVEQTQRQDREPDLWLLFAPIKAGRIDWLVEKATELGCSRLIPVMTRYTAVARVNLSRLSANMREAAEQCGRLTLPVLDRPDRLEAVLGRWPANRKLLFADESGSGAPILRLLGEDPRSHGGLALLVGPEGGFSPEEHELLGSQRYTRPTDLGPRILRSETAAVAGLAVIQALAGDWRRESVAMPSKHP